MGQHLQWTQPDTSIDPNLDYKVSINYRTSSMIKIKHYCFILHSNTNLGTALLHSTTISIVCLLLQISMVPNFKLLYYEYIQFKMFRNVVYPHTTTNLHQNIGNILSVYGTPSKLCFWCNNALSYHAIDAIAS